MKRIFTIMACVALLLAATSAVSYAKDFGSVSKVMKKYDGKPGVESFNLGKILIGLGRMSADNEDGAYLKYLDRMSILDGEDASRDVRESMLRDLKKALEGYETMMEMKDGDDSFAIYCRMKDEDTIGEMVMVEESDMAIILMKGSIPMSEIQNVAKGAMED